MHCEDSKQNVLCCIDCKNPEVDADKVQQRQEDTLLKLDVKSPGTVLLRKWMAKMIQQRDLDKNENQYKFKLGRCQLDHMTKLVVMEKTPKKESLSSREESDRHTMMFTQDVSCIWIEVLKVKHVKR